MGIYMWIRKVVQMVKNLPAMQETQIQSFGTEDALEKDMATHSSILAWRIPWAEDWWATVPGVTNSQTGLIHFHFVSFTKVLMLYQVLFL